MDLTDLIPEKAAAKALAIGLAVLLVGGAGAAAGYKACAVIKQAEIADLKRQAAEKRAGDAEAGLRDLAAGAARVNAAAAQFAGIQDRLGPKIDQIRKDIANAPKPLPADCKPDDFRMLKLSDAIGAAAEAAAGR
jgi:hypothetical protein